MRMAGGPSATLQRACRHSEFEARSRVETAIDLTVYTGAPGHRLRHPRAFEPFEAWVRGRMLFHIPHVGGQVIRPAIRRGKIVLCNRFLTSSRVCPGSAA